VRQRDLSSLLLFCIAENILSRDISKLVEEGKLELIKGTENAQVPSHTLHAEHIMSFAKESLLVLSPLDIYSEIIH